MRLTFEAGGPIPRTEPDCRSVGLALATGALTQRAGP